VAYGEHSAYERALELVKAALTSGSLKLQGSSEYPENNTAQLKGDTDYINGLINSIAANLQAKSPRKD
jgi:hypothetical protein